MQTQTTQHEIKRGRLKGQALLVGEYLPRDCELVIKGQIGVAVEQGLGGVGGDELGDARRKGRRDGLRGVRVWVFADEGAGDIASVCAEVEDAGKVALDILRRGAKSDDSVHRTFGFQLRPLRQVLCLPVIVHTTAWRLHL